MVLIIGGQGQITACSLSLLCGKSTGTPARKDALTVTSSDKPELPPCHCVKNQDAVTPRISQVGKGEEMVGIIGALFLSLFYFMHFLPLGRPALGVTIIPNLQLL